MTPNTQASFTTASTPQHTKRPQQHQVSGRGGSRVDYQPEKRTDQHTNHDVGRPMSLVPAAPDLDYDQITKVTDRARDSLSRTTAKVVHLLLKGDLARLRSDAIADELGISPTTLRRRLRADEVSYQELLDTVRQHRCEKQLSQRWLPGKTLAWELGYSEVNSFYRAFKRWTGTSYSEIKLQYI